MNIFVTTAPPTFVISFDKITQSITAHFSFDNPENISQREKEAMQEVAVRFGIIADQFANTPIISRMLQSFKSAVKQIIDAVYQMTGVKFNVNDRGLDFQPIYPFV